MPYCSIFEPGRLILPKSSWTLAERLGRPILQAIASGIQIRFDSSDGKGSPFCRRDISKAIFERKQAISPHNGEAS